MAMAYEVGPKGLGPARVVTAANIRCEVLTPSRPRRPTAERGKTDARDALHLAKLLRRGEIVAVRVPSAAGEAAREMVRAREETRATAPAEQPVPR
jgi:transposase